MKKIIIISSLFVAGLVFFVFFFKGTLIIKPSTSPVKITIDKKVYGNQNSLTKKLTPGTHRIIIEKENYKTYEENIKIGFLEKKEITPELELTEEAKDKQEVEKISKDFIEAWYTYDTQTSKAYLEKIKPFMTKDFYDGTYHTNVQRPQDFQGEVPLKSTFKSIEITSYSSNETEATIAVDSNEPTTGKSYQQKAMLILIKENNKWLVNSLEPILEQ